MVLTWSGQKRGASYWWLLSPTLSAPSQSLNPVCPPSTSLCPQCHLAVQAAFSPPLQFTCLFPSGHLCTRICSLLLCCTPCSFQISVRITELLQNFHWFPLGIGPKTSRWECRSCEVWLIPPQPSSWPSPFLCFTCFGFLPQI